MPDYIKTATNGCKTQWGCQRQVTFHTYYVCCHKYSHFCLFLSPWNLWEVRKFCHLFRPSRKRLRGLRCHFKALSQSNFRTVIFPFLCVQVTYTPLCQLSEKSSAGQSQPDHWLRLALVSNNTVCFLQFQMTDRETGTINTFYLLTHSHSVSLSDQSFLLLWLDHQIFLSLSLNTEGFQFSQAMIMFPIFIIMRRKKILKCWWSVLFIYCIAALLLTSPLGLILRMNVFFWGFWYSRESMGLRKCVCGTFICVLLLQNNEFAPGRTKEWALPFRWKEADC